MRKIIITFLIVSVFAGISAQSYTQVFDSVFQHVDLSHTSTGILYERVLPFSNLVSYVTNIPHPTDTCDYWQFVMAYDELYRAGARNTFLSDSLEGVLRNLPVDTSSVVFGIMHANFNTFDTAAIRQRLYFDADSVLWENVSVNVSLFNENNVYMVSPLVDQIASRTIRFILDGRFFFNNTTNPIVSLKIDFGDGYGERTVAMNTSINITYPSEGTKVLRIRTTFDDGLTVVSYAKLNIVRNLRSDNGTSSHEYTEDLTVTSVIQPYNPHTNGSFDIAQGDMRILYANPDKKLRKPILILDGFDPDNTRRFDTSYAKGGKSLWKKFEDGIDYNIGDSLLSLGYDIVLLDFQEGGAYIEQNSMVCVEAINIINSKLQESGSQEQIVAVGPSMGGLILRYAMAYMEHYPNENTNFGKHNCRLFVSFDVPYQGTNVPYGLQAMVYHYYSGILRPLFANVWNNFLGCKAAQEMIIYNKIDGSRAFYNTFYQQLDDFQYPLNSRNISLSNGGLNNISNGNAGELAYRMIIATHGLGYTIDNCIRNMAAQGKGQVFSATRWIVFIPITVTDSFPNEGNRGSLDVAPGSKQFTFDMAKNSIPSLLMYLGIVNVPYNQHFHCFMPITSVLDINEPIPYATDVSNRDLVAEGKIPFDSYWGPLNKNMEHISFDYDLVDYLLNEIETYIQGPRDIQLCTRPTYTLHLPQNTNATVTWLGSDNIQIIPTNNPNIVNIAPLSEGDAWISAMVSTLEHNDTLAHYPIHIINNENFIPAVEVTTVTGQTMVIHDERYLTSDTFCIESGKTLTVTGTLHCVPNTRLIVRPGGKLIVDGGTLTSACDGLMWQGIEVLGDPTKRQQPQYQGTVELKNGARIENAMCAIRTGGRADTVHYFTTGGIISAENTTFRNNRQSVVINSYAYTAPSGGIANYNATFSRCTFTVDNNNLFAANNTGFAEHARLWDVKGVKFEGCSFSNSTNNLYGNGRGIYADDAGVYVETYCPRPLYYTECECPESIAVHSSFSGFLAAMEVSTTGNPYSVTVDGARFENNGTGVKVNGNNFAAITRCQFNLEQYPGHLPGNTGLVLAGCSGYTVEENYFTRTTYPSGLFLIDNCTGISVSNSGISDNSLYRNTFTNLTYGISVVGTNGHHKWDSGLQMTCNSFVGGKYDILLASNATVRKHQGSSTKGADNEFSVSSNNIKNFHNPGAQPISYYCYSGTSNLYPTHSTGLTITTIGNSNSCSSTLCNNGGFYLPLSGFTSQMDAYASAAGSADTDGADGDGTGVFDTPLQAMHQSLSETYYDAVRALMADSVLDLNVLEQWHTAAQPIGDPYSLTETRFMEGYAETFATDAEDAEMSNYAEFHAMKLALRGQYDNQDNHNLQYSPTINWYALTDAQIAQLQTIAERNTGRASVMAKGVLCFFFGICYDDDLLVDDNLDNQDNAGNQGNQGDAETRSAKSAQQDGETHLNVYPNPTDDVLYVELSGAGIAHAVLYDLQGRAVGANNHSPLQGTTATLSLKSIPAGVYLLRVTDENGREYHRKVVVK